MDDNECPICYCELLIKDGKCNSDYEENCKHYICVDCCYELADLLNTQMEVGCPLCREDWTDWLIDHYTTDQ